MDFKVPFIDLKKADLPYHAALQTSINRVLDSGVFVGGPEVERFESLLARFVGTRYAVSIASGLDALRLSLRAFVELGWLKKGDRVILPSNTYIASALAVTDASLVPVLVDPDPATMTLSAASIEAAIDTGARALMPVHLYGRLCWDKAIHDVVRRHSLLVIEDCAQAIGAGLSADNANGTRRAGSLGNVGAFSFYPTKNIGCYGDGGAITTDNPLLAKTVRQLANYGSSRRYHNESLGFNSRLDALQAAILAEKLPFADSENDKRRRKADIYSRMISYPDIILPGMPSDPANCVWHQYVIRVLNGKRDSLQRFLAEHGVQTDIHYPTPIHRQPCYAGFFHGDNPVAEKLSGEILSLPIANHLSDDTIFHVSELINRFNC